MPRQGVGVNAIGDAGPAVLERLVGEDVALLARRDVRRAYVVVLASAMMSSTMSSMGRGPRAARGAEVRRRSLDVGAEGDEADEEGGCLEAEQLPPAVCVAPYLSQPYMLIYMASVQSSGVAAEERDMAWCRLRQCLGSFARNSMMARMARTSIVMPSMLPMAVMVEAVRQELDQRLGCEERRHDCATRSSTRRP